MSTLGWNALHAAIDREKAKGSGGERLLQLESHTRTSNAFAIYVMALDWGECGQPPAARWHGHSLLIGVVLGFVYVFQCQTDVGVGHPRGHPSWRGCVDTQCLFGCLGVFLYRRAPK